MRVHLIHAHPVADSYNAALNACIHRCLLAAGHEVDLLDLYAEGFQPVLSRAERLAYHDVGANLAGIESYVERLRRAEALVFCYPTWWYGMPAILKGYFDRVWAPGVAFFMEPNGGAIRPGLPQIRKFAVVTTCGSPWWLMELYMRNPGRAVLVRGLRRLFAPRARAVTLTHYAIDRSTPRSRARFLARVERELSRF